MNREAGGRLEDPDVQLMMRARKGDESAFEQLVNRHIGPDTRVIDLTGIQADIGTPVRRLTESERIDVDRDDRHAAGESA